MDEKAPSSKSVYTARRRQSAAALSACTEAMTATPHCMLWRIAPISSGLPSSSKSTTSGARHRIACKMPSALPQPDSTSQPCRVSSPESSPRSSTTATRSPAPFTGSASCRARSRSRLVFPHAGSPAMSRLCGRPSENRERISSSAHPSCGRAIRRQSEVMRRNDRTCPSCVTVSPATPQRQPLAARINPCRSSSSCACTA